MVHKARPLDSYKTKTAGEGPAVIQTELTGADLV